MTFAAAQSFVACLEPRIGANDAAVISFYSRSSRSWRELRQATFLRQAQAQALKMELAGLSAGDYVIVVGATPEGTLLNFLAAMYAGAIPTILPVRAAFDSREVIQRRLVDADDLLNNNTFIVIEEVKGKAVAAPIAGRRTLSFDSAAANLVEPSTFRLRDLPSISHVQLTSGSTGAGKGVAVGHLNLLSNLDALAERAELTPYDVSLTWLPLYHDMGLVSQALLPLALGMDAHFMSPFDFMADPVEWLRAMSSKKVTGSASPTFGYDLITKRVSDEEVAKLDLSNWKVAFCGAEPVRSDVMQAFLARFRAAGLNPEVLVPSYGLAEATLAVTAVRRGDLWRSLRVITTSLTTLGKIELAVSTDAAATEVVSLGRPCKDVRVDLFGKDGLIISEDLLCGEVVVNGPSVAAGWLHPGAILEPFAAEGLRTGDIGFWHQGELFVVDRVKNIVIRNGQNYSAQVIEQVLAEVAGVSADEVVVVDLDIQSGSGLTGVIEIEKKADPEPYLSQIKLRIDQFEPPLENVVFVRRGSLPRTTSGKKRHLAVREALNDGTLRSISQHDMSVVVMDQNTSVAVDLAAIEAQTTENFSQVELESRILELVSSYIRERGLDVPVAMASRLQYDLDFDSLGMLDLAMKAEEMFRVELAREAVSEIKTVRDLASAVEAAAKAGSSGYGGIANALQKLKAEVPQYFTVIEDVRPAREIKVKGRWMTDFASSGYLGFEDDERVYEAVSAAHRKWGLQRWGSRAIGMPQTVLDLEARLADFVGVPDTMIFGTITMLHLGVLPVLAGNDGAIIIDSAAHTSMQEAATLARGKGTTVTAFKHEDLDDLEQRLARLADKSRRIIVLDGVYSMSGACLDVKRYQEIAQKYDAWLYIDDAHGFGVVGENPTEEQPLGHRGNGVVRLAGTSYDRIFYIGGLGKAFSTSMGFITCPTTEYRDLFHSAFPVIFGHLASTDVLAQAQAVMDINDENGDERRAKVRQLAKMLTEGAENLGFHVRSDDAAIINVTVGDIDSLILATNVLWDDGIKITPAMFPAVPLNEGGLRFTITATNTDAQVEKVLDSLTRIKASMAQASQSTSELADAIRSLPERV